MERMVEQAKGRFDYIRFTWADLHGIPRCKTVPIQHFASDCEGGVRAFLGFDCLGPRCEAEFASELPEFASKGLGNARFIPVPGTLHPVPWASTPERRVGRVICESAWPDFTPMNYCARYVARQQLQKLQDEFGLQFYCAFEYEVRFLDRKTLQPAFEGIDMFSELLLARFEPLLYEIEKNLRLIDIDVVGIDIESCPGQFEINIHPEKGIRCADAAFLYKGVIKEVAERHGYFATFMSRPLPVDWGSSGHFNHSLQNAAGENVFFEAEGFSETGRHWLGGLLHHGPALTALSCPTVNCYRRLSDFITPGHLDWGLDDRKAAFRVAVDGARCTRIEARIPSSACNPYIVLAAHVAAGLDGLRNKMAPGPATVDRSNAPEGCRPVAKDLTEALEQLQQDSYMRDELGHAFIDVFVGIKRELELKPLKDSDITKNTKEDDANYVKEREMYMDYI